MSNIKAWNKVMRQLKGLLDALPPREDRDELVRVINEIVSVLTQVGSSLSTLPTSEEAAEAKEALGKLEFILNRNPLLRGVALKAKRERVSRVSQPVETSREDILQEIEALAQLSEGDLRTQLNQDERYSKEFLRSILSELGRKAPSRASKGQIIDQIVVAITTRRTYEGLRGG
jgi:hypothetical protein